MKFIDMLSDLEQLVGKQLPSINPSTQPICLTALDKESKKYYVASSAHSSPRSRSLRELETIWLELTRKGFSNVEQALYGGGSSRNHPETVLAHLPYIQHFKFKKKKHLLLRTQPVHPLGELSEVKGDELFALCQRVNNYTQLSTQDISSIQSNALSLLQTSCEQLINRYPQDEILSDMYDAIISLVEAEQVLSNSIVSLDNF